jgi:hypothetical protein
MIGAPLAMLFARTLVPSSALADDFYGFDPATFNGAMLSAANPSCSASQISSATLPFA